MNATLPKKCNSCGRTISRKVTDGEEEDWYCADVGRDWWDDKAEIPALVFWCAECVRLHPTIVEDYMHRENELSQQRYEEHMNVRKNTRISGKEFFERDNGINRLIKQLADTFFPDSNP